MPRGPHETSLEVNRGSKPWEWTLGVNLEKLCVYSFVCALPVRDVP